MRRSSFKKKSYGEILAWKIVKAEIARMKPYKTRRAKLKRGSMICTIPPKMRAEMAEDPFYKQSALSGRVDNIQWHHNLIYNKKRVNEKWAIIPLTEDEHREEAKHKDKLNWIMTNRASDEELDRYSKAVNYKDMRVRLNKQYGNYHSKRSTNIDK